jgi:ubiquitin carboxyl-terminal hydrolase L3
MKTTGDKKRKSSDDITSNEGGDKKHDITSNEGDKKRKSPDDSTSNEGQHWLRLVNDPSILNSYIDKLGFDTSLYELTDVLSPESWAQAMIPQPVAAVIMFYPLTDVQLEHHRMEHVSPASDDVWFIKEHIENACGTIALLHALLNLPVLLRTVVIRPDSWLHSFNRDCPVSLSPATKSERLEGDSTIKMLHDMAARDESNQASLDNFNDEVDTHYVALVHDNNRGHYVALVHVNGGLYELDGRKEGPIRHCDTTQETLLKDACKVVENFMKHDPHEMRFSILALVPKNILVLSPKMTSK